MTAGEAVQALAVSAAEMLEAMVLSTLTLQGFAGGRVSEMKGQVLLSASLSSRTPDCVPVPEISMVTFCCGQASGKAARSGSRAASFWMAKTMMS